MPTSLVAVSGLGSIGLQHVHALVSRGDVRVAGFEPAADLRDRALDRGVRTAATEFEALLDLNPNALIIAAPDHAHLSQLQAAAARGIPTLVEKPLAPALAEARAVAETIRATGTPVLVGYVLRHRAAVQAAQSALADGAVGTPTSFQVMLGAYETTGGLLTADFGRGTITVRAAGEDFDRQYAYPEPPAAALRRQVDHLLDIATGTAEPAVSLDDGLAALAVTEGIQRSATSGTWAEV